MWAVAVIAVLIPIDLLAKKMVAMRNGGDKGTCNIENGRKGGTLLLKEVGSIA